MLRVDPGLRAALKAVAGTAGVSLNEYGVSKLAGPGAPADGPGAEAVARAGPRSAND